MRRLLAFLRHNGGGAAMEFAMIAPILFALVGGIMEYGRVLFAENSMRAIIDEAARHGVVRNLTEAAVETLVDDAMAEVPGLDEYTVDVTDGTSLTITVTGTFNLALVDLLPNDLRDVIEFSLTTQYPR